MAVSERINGRSPINQVSIVSKRDGGLVEAMVPINLVYREDVPVDQAHVTDLADSMRREAGVDSRTGQLSPVLLGEILNFSQFPIIDGFHRVAALSELQRQEVFATLRPNCTWEDVVDLRILAATTHRSVRFSRLIEWVAEAWSFSQWADRIRVSQAFNLKVSPTMTGERLGLKSEEIEEIKEWVDRKSEQWHISHNSLYNHLTIANIAAPDLVREARERKGGHKLEALTPQHLGAIARLLPHRHDLQRMVASVTTDLKLTVPRARALATAVATAKDEVTARRVIDTATWTKIVPVYSPSRERQLRRAEGVNLNPELVDEFYKSQRETNPHDTESINSSVKDVTLGPEEMVVTPELETSVNGKRLTDEQTLHIMEVMDRTGPKVQSYLYKKFGLQLDESEDIISEAVLRTFAKIKAGKFEYKGDIPLRGWTYRVAGRIAIDRHRTAIAQERAFAEVERKRQAKEQDGAILQVEEELVEQLTKGSLPFLTEDQRRVIVLRDVFHTQIVDIAKILVSSEDAIKKLLFRARGRTRQLISNGAISF